MPTANSINILLLYSKDDETPRDLHDHAISKNFGTKDVDRILYL